MQVALPFRLVDADDGPATPLGPGPTLLEASAGTGKTFAIAAVVLRLVLEHGIGLERIAIMTFTRAATAELRERIRARLAGAAAVLDGGGQDDDPVLAWLRARHAALPPAGQTVWRRRLRAALAQVDAAPISTIHGFAHRVAVEHAAAVGIDPAAEQILDLGPWRDQAVRDWFRRELGGAGRVLAGLLGASPVADLARIAMAVERHPGVRLATAPMDAGAATAELAEAAAWWADHRPRLVAHAGRALAGIPRNFMHHPEKLPARLAQIDALLADGTELGSADDLWSVERLGKIAASGKAPRLDAGMFTVIPERLPQPARIRAGLQAAFAVHYRERLRMRPGQARDLHANDAILALERVLESGGPAGAALADGIGRRFDAVLVDEFQDTDLLQWRILQRCFGGEAHRLVLIGDPKQAIFAFRGADVFAYAAARRRVPEDRRFTLATNHRSDRSLVAAINALYLGGDGRQPLADPFAVAGIGFPAVTAARDDRFVPGSLEPEPLQLLVLEEAPNADEALRATVAAVVGEIARLLDPASGVAIRRRDGMRPVGPADIAVLVRAHQQADRVHAALRAAGIPAVRQDRSSVFAAPAAGDLQALLAGCLDPAREAAVRAALATRLAGAPATDLAAADESPALARAPLVLAELGEVLRRRGPAAWWYALLDADLGWGPPRARLAGLADGDRLLADAQHLVELMAAAVAVPADALADWLLRQAADPEDGEELQRRLERDAAAVRILTVHVSKGLQYPIVFEAFAWQPCRAPAPPLAIHPGDTADAELHTGMPEGGAVGQAEREELGDALRKLYVGLTRAEHRLYLLWLPCTTAEQRGACQGALAWLLHSRSIARDLAAGAQPYEAVRAACAAGFSTPEHDAIRLRGPLAGAAPAVAVRTACATGERADPPAIDRFERLWWRCSFSHLHGLPDRGEVGGEGAPETAAVRADDDQAPPAEVESAPAAEAPRGADFGTVVHACFEHADLAAWRRDPELPRLDLVRRAGLAGIAIDEAASRAFAAAMRTAVVEAAPGVGSALADLAPAALAREWAVRLRIARRTPPLSAIFADRVPQAPAWPRGLARTTLPPGVFTGVVDALVAAGGRYHIIDWKTNWSPGYGERALWTMMAGKHYLLQAHLYLLAAHRFLRWRLGEGYDPARHLGVAAFAFLRGCRGGGSGWAVVQPDPRILEALDACCDP
jgi:exodeoxyribonuclease V beta subunit